MSPLSSNEKTFRESFKSNHRFRIQVFQLLLQCLFSPIIPFIDINISEKPTIRTNIPCIVCIDKISFLSSSVIQSCLTLCDSMNRSTPGLPVHHQLLEFTQTHVHRVGDAIQPPHPLSSPSPPCPSPSQHQGLFR